MTRYANVFVVVAAVLVGVSSGALAAEDDGGPVKVRSERFYPVLMPSGTLWGVSVQALAEGRLAVCAVESSDGGRTWGERRTLVELPRVTPPTTSWGDGVPLVDRNGVLHYFVLRWDQTDKKAPFPKLALWHLKSPAPYEKWTEPKLWFDGYIGALLSAVEMPNGTLVSPFAYMTDRHYSKPAEGLIGYIYMGEHTTTAVYSTDGGDTFQKSPTPVNLRASIIIGNENGAIEPVCLPLKDGRAWMLI
ncbi:MAG: sialidase family protein, partial [Planctomycetaceae bacterium]